jgi:transcriptional regulator with XRE-family HTH domain
MENDKNSSPTTFKALQRETTLYKYYVELKEDVFTEHGFFDLIKVPDLRVTGVGHFLKNLRVKTHLRQKDIAKIIGSSPEGIKSWEKNHTSIPLKKLIKIAETFDISKDTIYSLIHQGTFTTKNNLPVKFESIRNFIQYLNPRKADGSRRITLYKCCPDEMLPIIKKTLNINPMVYDNITRIYCVELYNYLTAFFRYSKVPKIHPPLTIEVKRWYNDNVDLLRAVIIPCLQTDGDIRQGKKAALRFTGNNKILHDYFVDAMHYVYNEFPTAYFMGPTDNTFRTEYGKKAIKKIRDEIMNLAGNAKTCPANGQSIFEYSKEPQPHLDYLKDASKTEQQIALRIWSSTEGSISVIKRNNYIYPCLEIACAHPDLVAQLQEISKRFKIKFLIAKKESTWSGINRLSASSLNSCIRFLRLGSFIKGVKISSHSRYHEGIDKDVLFLGILEFKKQELEDGHLKLPIQQVHHEINKIIENKGYKSADYYINYFS